MPEEEPVVPTGGCRRRRTSPSSRPCGCRHAPSRRRPLRRPAPPPPPPVARPRPKPDYAPELPSIAVVRNDLPADDADAPPAEVPLRRLRKKPAAEPARAKKPSGGRRLRKVAAARGRRWCWRSRSRACSGSCARPAATTPGSAPAATVDGRGPPGAPRITSLEPEAALPGTRARAERREPRGRRREDHGRRRRGQADREHAPRACASSCPSCRSWWRASRWRSWCRRAAMRSRPDRPLPGPPAARLRDRAARGRARRPRGREGPRLRPVARRQPGLVRRRPGAGGLRHRQRAGRDRARAEELAEPRRRGGGRQARAAELVVGLGHLQHHAPAGRASTSSGSSARRSRATPTGEQAFVSTEVGPLLLLSGRGGAGVGRRARDRGRRPR